MRRIDCNDRIKAVKSSYEATLQTVQVLIGLVTEQPGLIYTHDLDVRAMQNLKQTLHDIYFVQMFASFESSLRDYWRNNVKDSKPLTMQLIASVAARRGVADDTRDIVQEIREFRNLLIHEEHEVKKRFTIDEASAYLNTYLARLPLEW
jgi:hypothetical protein